MTCPLLQLTSELAGQPGAPAPSTGRSTVTNGTNSPAKDSTPSTPTPVPVGPADLLPAIAAGVRKLRGLSTKRWKESPPLQITAQELSDVMQLYVDEVGHVVFWVCVWVAVMFDWSSAMLLCV